VCKSSFIELLASTYFPPIQAVFQTLEPAVIVMALTVTMRSEPKLAVDIVKGDEPVASITPFFCVHVPERMVQSGLEGSLLRVLPEVTVTCTVIKCTRVPLVALTVIEYWPLAVLL